MADGYARNYLIPKGLAQVVTPEILKRAHKIKVAGDQQRARETQVMEELAQILDNTTITVSAQGHSPPVAITARLPTRESPSAFRKPWTGKLTGGSYPPSNQFANPANTRQCCGSQPILPLQLILLLTPK